MATNLNDVRTLAAQLTIGTNSPTETPKVEKTDKPAKAKTPTLAKRLAVIDELDNMARKIRKSDDTRRRVGHVTFDTGEELAALELPSEIAKYAMSWGITEAEAIRRATDAPNFGQYRMVIGNRVRAIKARLDQFGGDLTKAAYPKEARKAARAKAATNKTVKVVKKSSDPATEARIQKLMKKQDALAGGSKADSRIDDPAFVNFACI